MVNKRCACSALPLFCCEIDTINMENDERWVCFIMVSFDMNILKDEGEKEDRRHLNF